MKPSKKKAAVKTQKAKPIKRSITRKQIEPSPGPNEELVVVYESSGPLAAEVVKGKLESEGIEALIKYDTAESVFPVTVQGLGKVRVYVHSEDEARAQQILKP